MFRKKEHKIIINPVVVSDEGSFWKERPEVVKKIVSIVGTEKVKVLKGKKEVINIQQVLARLVIYDLFITGVEITTRRVLPFRKQVFKIDSKGGIGADSDELLASAEVIPA